MENKTHWRFVLMLWVCEGCADGKDGGELLFSFPSCPFHLCVEWSFSGWKGQLHRTQRTTAQTGPSAHKLHRSYPYLPGLSITLNPIKSHVLIQKSLKRSQWVRLHHHRCSRFHSLTTLWVKNLPLTSLLYFPPQHLKPVSSRSDHFSPGK